jgi:micrococcal nuclease
MYRMVIVGILFAFGVSIECYAGTGSFGDAAVSEVTSIYDADTFRVNINGWPPVIGSRIPVRIANIDTPELRGQCATEVTLARRAKSETVAALRAAKKIELRNMKRDKYFRINAEVYVDGANLGDILLNKGFARPYDGGKKSGWCQ